VSACGSSRSVSAPTGSAIGTSYGTDSNFWYSGTATNLGNTQSALVINNSGHPTVDEDSGGNGFFGITVQPADPGSYTGPLFQYNQSHGTLIEGTSITGGMGGYTNQKIVGTAGSPQFRIGSFRIFRCLLTPVLASIKIHIRESALLSIQGQLL
jgi:hypothetical protein